MPVSNPTCPSSTPQKSEVNTVAKPEPAGVEVSAAVAVTLSTPIPKLFSCAKLIDVKVWASPATGTDWPSFSISIPSPCPGAICVHRIPVPVLFKKKLAAPGCPALS